MREIQYRNFSSKIHRDNLRSGKFNTCQFELTFRCGFHCRHCYTDCYNKPRYLKKELGTKEIKRILDKIHEAGAVWLCFTGGDPLERPDFLDIYSYAREKGFVVSIFTNVYNMTDGLIELFKKKPPFAIEITLNAVTKDLYEKICRVKGSFAKVMKAIDMIVKNGIPLKIKTQVTRDNLEELPAIRRFVRGLGLRFLPSIILYPRLDGDSAPCGLRISPREVMGLGRNRRSGGDDCALRKEDGEDAPLYPCVAASGDGFYIDPYGSAFFCNLIRQPRFNALEDDIKESFNRLSPLVTERRFLTGSKCKDCALKEGCLWCPGRAYLEKGDIEAPIEYYCELARIA